ncbi:MAG: ATPase, partial [Dehalococcoidia bacterium]
MQPPKYFLAIQQKATSRWDQLDADPDLAGPWHHLFRQVAQSPRNVLSELLQNADDADATEASVDIIDGEFIFSHNGIDFNSEQFQSLCRFGFSNKRALHTIGFRGIGFKSTFSLGDQVRLFTPTLAVAFNAGRFTQPIWLANVASESGLTEVRIKIIDERRARELEKNIKEWISNPTSLLFFRRLRSLRVREQVIRWVNSRPGPCVNSHWVSLSTAPDKEYLHIISQDEQFPEEALTEIKQECPNLEKETTFPPCKVEIVLGVSGRLYVVLPTGVKTSLPFACNAPFVQDPARLKIKESELSPTNRWLLARVGKLAGDSLIQWLNSGTLPAAEKCQAYDLWP